MSGDTVASDTVASDSASVDASESEGTTRRFILGLGNPGCSNVRWLTNVEPGTRRVHCNSATLIHQGGGQSAVVRGAFSASSCARVVVRCEGPC